MSNEDALKQYDVKKYRTPDGYTADIAVFTIRSSAEEIHKPASKELCIMLIQRSMKDSEGRPNMEAGKWAIPGGFVGEKESAFESAGRELIEETGVSNIHLKHYGVYDKPGRDPRGWIISNAHYAIVPEHALANRKANDDAAEVELIPVEDALRLELAFDHRDILNDAIAAITRDLLETTIAKEFLPSEFTYSELQAVLLTVTNDPQIASNSAFARKLKNLPFIEKVEGKKTTRSSKKPAQLYRFKDVEVYTSIYRVNM